MNESSVSPDRCEVITPQPAFFAIFTASMASVTVPIWFTLSRRALHAFCSIAFWSGLAHRQQHDEKSMIVWARADFGHTLSCSSSP